MTDSQPFGSEQFNTRRVLPKRALFTGGGLRALVYATLATLALLGWLTSLALMAAVAATGGDASVAADRAAAAGVLLGEAAPADLPVTPSESRMLVSDAGVLPVLLEGDGDSPGPGWLAWLAGAVPSLLSTRPALAALAVSFAFLAVIHHWLEIAAAAAAESVGRESADRLRSAVHRQALRLNVGDLDGRGSQDSQNLFTTHIESARQAVTDLVRQSARVPLRVVVLMAVLVAIDWRLTVLAAIPAFVAYAFSEAERVRSEKQQRLAESKALRTRRLLSEGLRKSRLIRGYGLEAFEHDQFDRRLSELAGDVDGGQDSSRWRQRTSWTLGLVVAALVLYLTATKTAGSPGFGVFEATLFLMTLAAAGVTLLRARDVPEARRRTAAVSGQINRYLDRVPEVSQAVGARFLEPVTKHITYENVKLARGGRTLLDGLEMRLPADSKTALVSLDPSEARAAAFLLPRFLEPDEGRVLFDGEDIVWATLESLREECCYVGGREPFFTGTVRENIAAGQDLSLGEVTEAAKLCHAHKFVTALSRGYDTVLGEHGESLAPGPAFLLGLARAMTRDPATLVVEEPPVSLSSDLKDLIDDAYQRILPGRTVVFLPTRLSTVRRCDRVVVLEHGKARANGHQQDLVKSDAVYRHWEYVTFNPLGRS